jgi:hypothetical protein
MRFRRSFFTRAAFLSLLLASCDGDDDTPHPFAGNDASVADTREPSSDVPVSDAARFDATTSPDAVAADDHWFEDVAEEAGVTYEQKFPSTLLGRFQGGVCLLDADGDGAMDLFFPSFDDDGKPTSRLYLARGAFHFVEETSSRGLALTGEAIGCVAFDVDGDGDRDLLTVGRGASHLFRNDAGYFADVSARLGAQPDDLVMSTSPVAFDADRDGDLDLAIGVYGRYRPAPTGCRLPCEIDPDVWVEGTPRLLFQREDGTFEDVSDRLGSLAQPGLSLLATDLEHDGIVDLFVGNDLNPNIDHYFHDDGKGRFLDVGATLGVMVSGRRSGICSMSANDGDVDADGHLDLLESTWSTEPSPLFRCTGVGAAARCVDISEDLELFRKPINVRWGQVLVDFDDDGLPELFEAMAHLYQKGDFSADAQDVPEGSGAIMDVPLLWHRTSATQPLVMQPQVGGLASKTGSRGVVASDLDGDGDLDLVVGTAVGRPLLLENVRGPRGHAITLSLAGAGKNTFAVGTRVTIRAGARTWSAMTHAGNSYHSSDDGRIHVGIGDVWFADSVDVAWPTGKVTHLEHVPVDGVLLVREP